MKCVKQILCAVSWCLFLSSVQAQQANKTGKAPVVISGSVGMSANIYLPNDSTATRQPFAWSTYGSFVVSKRYFSLPVSFLTSRYRGGHTPGFSQFGVSPTYKWATLYIGNHNLFFSPLVYQGLSFRGVGLSIKPGLFRLTAFYGKLLKAFDGDTLTPLQYKRTGYGVKLGVGNAGSYFNLMYFHAKDDSASASYRVKSGQNTKDLPYSPAQENAVAGASFQVKFFRKLFLAGDGSVSGLTRDTGADTISRKVLDIFVFPHADLIKRLYGPVNKILLPINTSTILKYAAQSSLSLRSRYVNSSVSYKRVSPGFKSLGTLYQVDDLEQVMALNSVSLLKGRLNISTTFTGQHNNLDGKKPDDYKALAGMAHVSAMISRKFVMNLSYAGYDVAFHKVTRGRDSSHLAAQEIPLKTNQRISQLTVNPTYTLLYRTIQHTIGGNITWSGLQYNTVLRSSSVNQHTLNFSGSLNYNLGFSNKPLSFFISSLYNQYGVERLRYASYGVTTGTSVLLLKGRELNMQGNVGYFINTYQGNIRRNITYAVNTGYFRKHQGFSLFASYVLAPYRVADDSVISEIRNRFPSTVTAWYLSGGMSYTYRF